MYQRIQTIYLFLAIVTSGILPFFIPLWLLENGKPFFFIENFKYIILNTLTTTLSFISIFSFNKRQNQFVMGRINIILNLILLALFINHFFNIGQPNILNHDKDLGIILPIFTIVLLVLANKAIKKDDNLLKSVDRIR